jgi:carbamoylphosphate synthase large subunit
VHAVWTFRELGYEAVMVNCNPETVSTDYDTSDRLYFEPLDTASVLAVCRREQPEGVVIQFGGQTPLKLAAALEDAGVRILGTPFGAVDLAEDRERFGRLTDELGIRVPPWGIAETPAEAAEVAERIGYPVLVRPSYVLGGRAMAVCYDESTLAEYMRLAAEVSEGHPVLIDRYLKDAIEIDLDCLADGKTAVVAGILQHIEEAGIHSGDSAAVLPPWSVPPSQALAKAAPNSSLAPITSPVDFISGPSTGSTPGKRRNGNTGALTNTPGTGGSSVSPFSASVWPAISRQAIATRGSPTALAMNGTVREARGFTSRR